MTVRTDDGPRSALRFPWGFGLVYGGLAYVAGYLATLLLTLTGSFDAATLGGHLRVAGYAFYGAHGVPVADTNFTTLVAAGGGAPELAYWLVPLVVLAVAGLGMARGYVGVSAQQAVLAGAAVATGYALTTLMGVVGFEGPDGLAPDPLVSLALMGLAYPFLLGGLGGYLSTRL